MIELINNAGTESFGRANNMRSAQGILNSLVDAGEISAGEPVICCQIKSGELIVSEMVYNEGTWRIV